MIFLWRDDEGEGAEAVIDKSLDLEKSREEMTQ